MFTLRARPIASVAVLTAAILWVYGGVLASLAHQWASDDDYSHGFFVLPLAAFFVWERRAALARAPIRPHWAGFAVVLLGVLLLLAGLFGAELFLTRVSLLVILAGLVLFVWGGPALRILAFPLAFLLLMIPLPAIVFNKIAFPLQLLASRVGETAIAAAGIPVLREGNVLQLPSRTLEVAEACSGIRSLVSLLMLAIVLGYFTERRVAVRAAVALAAIPIAIAANAARVAGTAIAAEWISPAAADGFLHLFSGWLMFVLAFVALLAFHRLAFRWRPRAPGVRPRSVEAG